MRKTTHTIAIAALALACLFGATSASADVSAEYTLDLASAYVWRGLSVTDGLVFQPGATISHDSGFSLSFWGNMDLDDVNSYDGDFIELDIILDYAFDTDGPTDFSIGLIEYLFPVGDDPAAGGAASTTEIYLALSWDVALSPAINLYYDFDQVDGFYGDVGLSWGTDFSESGTFEISALAGYADDDYAVAYGGTEGGFYNGQVTLSIGWAPENGWGFGGYVAYSDSLDKDALPTQPVDFFGGIGISRSF